jgi:hypothetical protein
MHRGRRNPRRFVRLRGHVIKPTPRAIAHARFEQKHRQAATAAMGENRQAKLT